MVTVFNKKNREKMSYTLLRVVWKLFEVDKKTRFYGTDVALHEAEIHIVKAIQENEGIHVTNLAEKLNVTKGAVSQILMKLEKKSLIIKDRDPQNQSRLSLRLTEKGKLAYVNHEEYHRTFELAVNEVLENASQENINFLKDFLVSLENKIEEYENEHLL